MTPLRRHKSSPAAFEKAIQAIHRRAASITSIHSDVAEPSALLEQYCVAANSCAVYEKESRHWIRLVESKLGAWQREKRRKHFTSSCLREAGKSIERFKSLVGAAVLRFEGTRGTALECLATLIIEDTEEVMSRHLFREAWLRAECQCVATVCATFTDYCSDMAKFLARGVYEQFLQTLFDSFADIYATGKRRSGGQAKERVTWAND